MGLVVEEVKRVSSGGYACANGLGVTLFAYRVSRRHTPPTRPFP